MHLKLACIKKKISLCIVISFIICIDLENPALHAKVLIPSTKLWVVVSFVSEHDARPVWITKLNSDVGFGYWMMTMYISVHGKLKNNWSSSGS